MRQQVLQFDKHLPRKVERFDGETFDAKQDGARLTSQLYLVRDLMLDGCWRTLPTIAELTGGSESGVSARLRDLRKTRFGGYVVERRRTAIPGLFEYRVLKGAA